MEAWIEFAAARYNYWIVIVLMMTGLYIVYARGNLVKKVVGLNVFQTSVFIFYITIGKIAGGTAPIYIGDELKHGDGHGDGYGDGHGDAGYGDESHADTLHGADDANAAIAEHSSDGQDAATSLHDKVENSIGSSNDLKEALNALPPADGQNEAVSLHDSGDKISNDALADIAKPDGLTLDVEAGHGEESSHYAGDMGNAIADGAHGVGDIIYTNPLPHVLILTAIVVGVATTAVGLALAVRIREAYGTIEEDELDAIDNVAAFGPDAAATGAST